MSKRLMGCGMMVVGLIGCCFPIIPGIPLFIAGAALFLGTEIKRKKEEADNPGTANPEIPE